MYTQYWQDRFGLIYYSLEGAEEPQASQTKMNLAFFEFVIAIRNSIFIDDLLAKNYNVISFWVCEFWLDW